MAIFPENLGKKTLTPDIIMIKLSQFYEEVHLAHFNTTSFATHKNFDIWDDLTEFKDRIGELLLGYQAPKRFGAFSIKVEIRTPLVILNDIISFSHDLEEFADKNNYQDLCNVAQELEGMAVKSKYLLTLS